ncbi:hypothetical protein [Pseudomonas sp. P9(2020)]|uniref:hypothetical protein n=1 Tax=Pseudomonas sp. P9(2020) TaxID=2763316 RepID=UPI001B33873D|nr:hypothetical protein [Pseudomonas sp. P9(2020)]MBP5947891.1 hypothetical protein [Pseudomonas sp. P9(2020)]
MTAKQKHPCALDIPAYDLGALFFGVASATQILRAFNDQSLSEWQFAGLSVTLLITTFFAYKAHRMSKRDDISDQ